MLTLLVAAFAAILAAVTLLPLSGSHAWWVRMWDFPRVQIAIGQALVLAASPWVEAPLRWVVIAATLAGLALHLARIRPFTRLSRREMRLAPDPGDGAGVTLMAANVLMENARHDLVARLIEEVDPDVLLLMETDAAWIEALAPVLARYSTVLRAPRDDCYGMVFATRLRTTGARILDLTTDDTPSVFADLLSPAGTLFHFVGLHPQPPVPGVDTQERDAQILYAARFARATDVPLVVMGDFNDAAWSDTTRVFKHYGRYLDPRRGRGLYPSFHAKNILVRCAIDQLYVTEEVAMVSFRLGPKVGSDHLPVIARVRIDPEAARSFNTAPPPLTSEERDEIEARLADYAGRLRKRPVVEDRA